MLVTGSGYPAVPFTSSFSIAIVPSNLADEQIQRESL